MNNNLECSIDVSIL